MSGPQIGNGRLDAIQIVGPFTLADDTQPCLAVQWAPEPVRGEKQTVHRHAASITIDADGASGSKLLVTLTVKRRDFAGDDLADLTYAISGAAAKVAWSSTTASGTASAATLKDVVDLINEIHGFKAWTMHAPHAMSVNSEHFIDLAETYLKTGTGPGDYFYALHRDVSDFDAGGGHQVLWARIGLPEPRDRNAMRLLRVEGAVTGNTAGTVKVYRDDVMEYGSDQEVYLQKALTDTNFTNYLDRTIENADTIRGPVLLEVKATNLTVAAFHAGIMQAQIGA